MGDRIEILPVEEFSIARNGEVPDEVLNSVVPVVMRGLVANWPVVAAAGTDSSLASYLLRYDAGLPVTVYTSEGRSEKIGYKADYSAFSFQRNSATLKAVLDTLLAGQSDRTVYVGSTQVDKWLPDFRQANDIVIKSAKPLVSFWLGNQAEVSAHYDCPANIACCIAGRRTFTLFPPDQISNLYIGPVDLTPSGRAISLVDIENPDFSRFPNFRTALESARQVALDPGDALFLPPLWWHHVKSNGPINLLINYWWKTWSEYSSSPELALEHAILSLRGLPESQKQAWKALFDYYIFSDDTLAVEHIPCHIRGILDSDNEQAVRRGWLNLIKKLRM